MSGCSKPKVKDLKAKKRCGNVLAAPVEQCPLPVSWRTHDYALRDDLVQLVVDRLDGGYPVVDALASRIQEVSCFPVPEG